jgi:serine/threonine-protein kinase
MLTGQLPFDGRTETEVRLKIERGQYTDPDLLVAGMSKRSKRLIQKLLRINPNQRMSAKELLLEIQNPTPESTFSVTDWMKNLTDMVERLPLKGWFKDAKII